MVYFLSSYSTEVVHLHGKEKVSGSNPLESSKINKGEL